MDQISGLPKIILHDIISRLPNKDAARTSILSKAWRETWYTFPILSICDSQIGRIEIFPDYVRKRLLRFRDQGLPINEFKLGVNYFNQPYMSQHVDLWMKLATESGVKVLRLGLPIGHSHHQWYPYSFPLGVLEAKSLSKLELTGGIRVDQAFLNHSVKFFSLRVLSLGSVLLGDEGAIEHFISHCPLIEHITLDCCYVYNPQSMGDLPVSRTSLLKSLSMHGLQKLKGVDVRGITEFYIDAPNLENLCYCPNDMHAPCELNFDGCRNLRCLCLWHLKSTDIADKWFLDLFSKFPFLESLTFENCSLSERINISSAQLKVLELSNCSNLKKVNIDAPNLISCGYYDCAGNQPVISFLRSSSKLEINVKIHMDYLYLCNLRETIQCFKPQKVLASLSLFILMPHMVEPNLDILQVSSPPPSIKHLNLSAVPRNKASFLPFLNHLFSSCCPKTISWSLSSYFCSKASIEFFYETLMGRKEGKCHCSSCHTKCWWHGLKNVKVTSSVKIDENVDFRTMLDALPSFAPQETISFRLEM